MKRPHRRLFIGLALVFWPLFLLTVVLWARSYFASYELKYSWPPSGVRANRDVLELASRRGKIGFEFSRYRNTVPVGVFNGWVFDIYNTREDHLASRVIWNNLGVELSDDRYTMPTAGTVVRADAWHLALDYWLVVLITGVLPVWSVVLLANRRRHNSPGFPVV